MILHDTPDEQVFREMYNEMEKVDYAVERRTREIERMRFTTVVKFPIILYKEYTIPSSRNRYLIYHYGTSNDRLYVQWKIGVALLLTDDRGRLQTVMLTKNGATRQDFSGKTRVYNYWSLCFNSGHFYSRYHERAHNAVDLSHFETIITWFGRNNGFFRQIDPKDIISDPERYAGAVAIQTLDGIVFGEMSRFETGKGLFCEVCHQKTFVPLSMLKGKQNDAVAPTGDIRFLNNAMNAGIRPENLL